MTIDANDAGKSLAEALNPQQLKFLSLLLEGKKCFDAYKLAGYDGESHAAFVLRSRLTKQLEKLAEAKGLDKAGLMQELLRIDGLPLVRHDKFGGAHPIEGLTPDEFGRLLKLRLDLLKLDKAAPAQITNVTFERCEPDAVKINGTVIDVTPSPLVKDASETGTLQDGTL